MKSFLKISLKDIKSNWKLINKASNGKAAAVIKANAYGLGMFEIYKALLEAQVLSAPAKQLGLAACNGYIP